MGSMVSQHRGDEMFQAEMVVQVENNGVFARIFDAMFHQKLNCHVRFLCVTLLYHILGSFERDSTRRLEHFEASNLIVLLRLNSRALICIPLTAWPVHLGGKHSRPN